MTAHVSDNPELYARMAAPYASKDEANAALAAFLADVQAARERHRIAEVVLAGAIYVAGSADMQVQTAGFGHSDVLPFLSATVFGHFTRTILGAARLLESIARGEAAVK